MTLTDTGNIDIHCHILPGVDDGAADMDMAMEMLRQAYADGTRAMILTPHCTGRGGGDREGAFARLKELARAELPGLELYSGSEIRITPETGHLLEQGIARSLNGSRYCLVEFGTSVWRSQALRGISDIFYCGFIPVIAHPERYPLLRGDSALLEELLEMGALLQVNAGSILGRNGWGARRFCDKLLRAGKVHFVASDAHDSQKRPPLLSRCRRKISQKYGPDYARKLFYDHARAVLRDQETEGETQW